MRSPRRAPLFAAPLTALALALGPSRAGAQPAPVTVRFRAVVDTAAFACGRTYADVGTAKSRVTPSDFKLYVHDVRVVTRAGREVPLALTQDGLWQHENLALLDFENGAGPCANGTPEERHEIAGTVPADAAAEGIAGVRFAVGVPFARNHADQASAPSPLSLTRMFWSWNAGYKFLRVDMRTATSDGGDPTAGVAPNAPNAPNASAAGASPDAHSATAATRVRNWMVHLGSTACTPGGSAKAAPTACAHPNRASVALDAFDPAADAVVVDLAALLAGADVTRNQPHTAAGCMSADTDADCAPVFAALGLAHGRLTGAAAGQTFFRVERGGAAAGGGGGGR